MDAVEGKTSLFASALAGETKREANSLAGLPKRLGRYARAKELAVAFCDYLSAVQPQTKAMRRCIAELDQCAVWLTFRYYAECREVRLARVRSCYQHLVCPFCAIRRGARLVMAYMERLNVVLAQAKYAELVPWMLTPTVKDGEDLVERLGHLRSSLRGLRDDARRDRRGEMAKIVGMVGSYEIKRGANSGLWHPHGHIIGLANAPLDPNKLKDEWYARTGDSHQFEAHPMYGDRGEAFAEVFKYALKFVGMPHADRWAAAQLLKAKRLVFSSGVLWGVEVLEDNADELLEARSYVELFFRYFAGRGYIEQDSPARGVPPLGWRGSVAPSSPLRVA